MEKYKKVIQKFKTPRYLRLIEIYLKKILMARDIKTKMVKMSLV